MTDYELQMLIEDRIAYYTKELRTPLPDYYRGVCSGNLDAYRSILQKLKEQPNEQE